MHKFIVSMAVAVASLAAAESPSVPALSGSEIFARLMEHNRRAETTLNGYTVRRTYSAENNTGKVYAVEEVRMSYESRGEKSFEMVSGRGSWVVRDLVFNRLREAESEAARGKDRTQSSVTPENYRFDPLGTDQIDGRLCYVVQATPLHHSKYLFEGKVWIDATDFAIARIEGHPAANPSFWTRHVEFVRSYSKVGDFWLPSKDATVADIRLYGRKTLNISYFDYVLELNQSASAGR